jgi:hypothetical protein
MARTLLPASGSAPAALIGAPAPAGAATGTSVARANVETSGAVAVVRQKGHVTLRSAHSSSTSIGWLQAGHGN